MEKKLLNDKRSSSARCAPKRTMRICFAVMTIIMLLCSMIAPASAMGLESPVAGARYGTMLTGDVTIHTVDPDLYNAVSPSPEYQIGGIMPSLFNTGGSYYAQTIYDFMSQVSGGWTFAGMFFVGRYKQSVYTDITPENLDSYRITLRNQRANNTDYEDLTPYYFNRATFVFDPYYFEGGTVQYDVLAKLFSLRLGYPCKVSVSVDVSYIDTTKETDFCVTETFTETWGNVGNPNIVVLNPLGSLPAWLEERNSPAYVLLSNYTVNVDLRADGIVGEPKSNYISFDMLGMQWSSGDPYWISNGKNIDAFPNKLDTLYRAKLLRLNADVNQLSTELDDLQTRYDEVIANGGGIPNVAGFMANIARSFFDAELFPGFTFGGLFGILIAVIVIFLILKYFAGG